MQAVVCATIIAQWRTALVQCIGIDPGLAGAIAILDANGTLDVHFVSPAPVPPGNAGLQPGSRSYAGACAPRKNPRELMVYL